MHSELRFASVLISVFLAAGVLAAQDEDDLEASAVLNPAAGQLASGTIDFSEKGNSLRIEGKIRGLTPNSVHGFHVHEKGDCTNPPSTTGEHFNPANMPHGGTRTPQRHAGDLGNIKADEKGVARVDLELPNTSLEGTGSFVGRALIIHSQADDLVSQPSGNSGSPIACGAIELDE